MPEFGDVAHVRTGTGAHVNPVADLNDAELLHGNRKEVHVGSFRWHDGVDFSSGHDVVRDLQSRINPIVGRCKKVVQHGFVKRNWVEINSRAIGVDLISDGSDAVKHFVRQPADEMLGGVHPHVSVAGCPIDGTSNLIANLQLMFGPHRVMNIATTTNLGDRDVSVWTGQRPSVPVLPSSKGVKQRAVQHHSVVVNFDNACIKRLSVSGLDVLEVQFDGHRPHGPRWL